MTDDRSSWVTVFAKGRLLFLSARVCVQASTWFMSVFVFVIAQVCINGTSAEVSLCQLVSVLDRFWSLLATPVLARFYSMFWLLRVVCDSFLCVTRTHLGFFLPLSDFHFWLLLRVASPFVFWFLWNLRSSLFRLSFEVYCDCQCVPTLRGQPFKEIHDAGENSEESAAVILIALWGSSGFPPRHEQVCKFLVSSPSFLFSSLKPSEVSVPTFPLGSESSVCASLAAGVDTTSLRRPGFWRSSSSRVATSRVCETALPRCLWRGRK